MAFRRTILLFCTLFFLASPLSAGEADDDDRAEKVITIVGISEGFPVFLGENAISADYAAMETIRTWVKTNTTEYFRLIQVPENMVKVTFSNWTVNTMPKKKYKKFVAAYEKLYASMQTQRFELKFVKEEDALHQARVISGYTYIASEEDVKVLIKLLKGYAQ
jgi:hypothetical protein